MTYLDEKKISDLDVDEIVRYELVRMEDLVRKLNFMLFLDADKANIQLIDSEGIASDLILLRAEHLAGVNKMLAFELNRRETLAQREATGLNSNSRTATGSDALEKRVTELEHRMSELEAVKAAPDTVPSTKEFADQDGLDELSAENRALYEELRLRAKAMGSRLTSWNNIRLMAGYQRSRRRDSHGCMYFTRNNAAMPFHHHRENSWVFELPEELEALKTFIEADEEIYAAAQKNGRG